MRKRPLMIPSALCVLVAITQAQAQGIPVIDMANLTQALQNVLDDGERFEQLAQTISQLQTTYNSLTGMRNLAAALNNPAFQNYLPPAVYLLYNDVNAQGYTGLTQRAKALRDASMLYNCLSSPARHRQTVRQCWQCRTSTRRRSTTRRFARLSA